MSLVKQFPETPIEWYARKKLEYADFGKEFFIDVHIKHKLTETDFQNLCVLIYDHLYDLYGESYVGYSLDEMIFDAVKDEEFINILNVEIADKLFCDVRQELLAKPEEYFSGRDFAKTKKYKEILSYAKKLEENGDTKMSYDDCFGDIGRANNTWTETKHIHIPTVFVVPPELRMGQYWYVKYPGATALSEVEIMGVTEKTVVLKDTRSKFTENMRYEKTDVKFVEQVKEYV